MALMDTGHWETSLVWLARGKCPRMKSSEQVHTHRHKHRLTHTDTNTSHMADVKINYTCRIGSVFCYRLQPSVAQGGKV